MSVPRSHHACGIVEYKGQRVLMAIGGKYFEKRTGTNNINIHYLTIQVMDLTPGTDLTTQKWTTLDIELPHNVIYGSQVINMGGAQNEIIIVNAWYNQIIRLNPNNATLQKIEYQEKLNEVVTPINSEFLPSCYNIN